MAKRTIPRMFEESSAKFPNNILLYEHNGEKYFGTTYSEIRQQVHNFSCGLKELGINKGDRVALISEGRNQWVISELAILFLGAINVPISVKVDELQDLKFRLDHSGCKFAIVSSAQRTKISQIKNDLPSLKTIVLLDDEENLDHDEMLYSSISELGKKCLANEKEKFDALWQSVEEDDYANICYTSGTTADPKGIILTHRNYTANVEQSTALLPIPESYVSLLILPWDHSFAHTAGIYTLMKNGASMASVQTGKTPMETLKNIPENIKEIRPTFLLSVPALAKNFKKNIESGIRAKGPTVEKLFYKALETAYDYNKDGYKKSSGLNVFKKPLLKFYDKIIFSKIRENFGGRLQFFIGGGALLDIELQKFFYAIGIPMFQGYGLSESAPVISSNVPAMHKLGSSGKIVKDLQMKICDDNGNELPKGSKGEIVVKGENVMAGYWNNQKATDEILKDGWLYTGDLGYLDNDDFLYVLGRNKSLLIANDGEKYSPEGIEESLADHSIYIDQVMLYNNQSPFTVGLIVPNKEALKRFAKEKNLDIKSEEGKRAMLLKIKSEIDEYKKGGKFEGEFPERWLPTNVAVLGEAFTEQNKMLNSTLKMVRRKITNFYKQRIEFLFTSEARDICNDQNMNIIGKI